MSEDNPQVTVRWYDPAAAIWVDITPYVKTFRVRDAGVLKIPRAEITLQNLNGKFTSGTDRIPLHCEVRIHGKVREVEDVIFEGYYEELNAGMSRRREELILNCRGYAQVLLWDTITYQYGLNNEHVPGKWNLKDVIENFLANPDSGYNTGVILQTDTGDILLDAGNECNFDKIPLLDALRKIGERINYDGYTYVSDGILYLVFKLVGSEMASPAVTLTHPFVDVNYEVNLDEVYNYILPFGGISTGVPSYGDEWTENAVDKYKDIQETGENVGTGDGLTKVYYLKYRPVLAGSETIYLDGVATSAYTMDYIYGKITFDTAPGTGVVITADYKRSVWYGENTSTAVTDDTYEKQVNGLSVKLKGPAGGTIFGGLDIKNILGKNIDLSERFRNLVFWIKCSYWLGMDFDVRLEDSGGNRIYWGGLAVHAPTTWQKYEIPVGVDVEITDSALRASTHNVWCYVSPATSFDWVNVQTVLWRAGVPLGAEQAIWIDGFAFKGSRSVDPLIYPTWNPPVKDDTSISSYGRRVLPIEDQTLDSFEKAQDWGRRVLAIRKEPFKQVVCIKGAKIWVRPHQVVTLDIPEYEINNESWRVLEMETSFKQRRLLRTKFKLVPSTWKVSSISYREDELAGMLRQTFYY